MAEDFTRTDVDFVSSGTRCAAWLYRPHGVARPPVVVMAHGFGAERTFGLPAFAGRFAAAGLAVLLFDYRGFGAERRPAPQPGQPPTARPRLEGCDRGRASTSTR